MAILSDPFTQIVHGRPWVGGVKPCGTLKSTRQRLRRVYKRAGKNGAPDLYWIPGTVLVPVATENDFEPARSLLRAALPAVGDTYGILFLNRLLTDQFRDEEPSLARQNIQLAFSESSADSLAQCAYAFLASCGEKTYQALKKTMNDPRMMSLSLPENL